MGAEPGSGRPSRRAVLGALGGGAAVAGGAFVVPAAWGGGAGGVVPGAGGARVVSERRTGSRTVELRIDSPAAGRTLPVRVLLPPGWRRGAGRTWPVLHLLQGAHDTYTSWTRETDVASFLRDKDVIAVLPESGRTGIPTAWWHGGRGGEDYETFHVREVGAVLRARFGASALRAVAGVSTGGYGALALAARHPDSFVAAASYSGIPHTLLPGVPGLVYAIVARELAAPSALWGSPVFQRSNWRARDPFSLVERLRGKGVYVSCGSGGLPEEQILESSVWPSNAAFAEELRLRRVPARIHLYRGGAHSWPYWEREFHASWPLLARALRL